MRRLKILPLIAALAIALACGWIAAGRSTGQFAFELDASPVRSERFQFFYDIGDGFSEGHSVQAVIDAGAESVHLRLPLPFGTYRGVRLDTTDSNGVVSIARARITGPGGRTIRAFDPGEFAPSGDVASIDIQGETATVRPTPTAGDTYVYVALKEPVELRGDRLPEVLSRWPSLIRWTILLWAILVLAKWAWLNRSSLDERSRRHPQSSLLILGLAATCAACYPVVFLGKSFVSPNNGAALLYGAIPTVPGYTDMNGTNVHGTDIGALMWAHLPYARVQGMALFDDFELPLWDRYNSSGVSLLGQGQSMAGDPLHLLLIVATRGAAWAWDLKFIIARALFAAGLGLCAWRMTRDRTAAALVTLAAPFVGFFNYRLNHPAIFSISYAPWILFAWFWMTEADARRTLAKGIALWALANLSVLGSGTVKEAYMAFVVLNATGGLFWLLTSPLRGAARLRQGAIILGAGIACILLTTPLWLTFIDTLRVAFTTYDAPAAGQIPHAWFPGLFDDIFYREIMEGRTFFVPSTNFLFFLGILWALLQPVRLFKARGPLAMLVGALAALAMAFDVGTRNAVLATPMLRNLHQLNNIFSAVAIAPIAVLAGWGFHVARPVLQRVPPWRPLAIGAGVTAILLMVYFSNTRSIWLDGAGFSGWKRRLPEHAYFYVSVLLAIGACALLTVLAARRLRGGRPAGMGAFALGGLALGVLFYRNGMHSQTGLAVEYLTAPMLRANLYTSSPAVDFLLAQKGEPFRAAGTESDFFAGFTSVYGLEGINGPDAVMNRPYHELAVAGGLTSGGDWHFPLETGKLAAVRPMLSLLGTRYILSRYRTVPEDSGLVKAGSFDLEIYRDPRAWPRAFFTDRLGTYGTAADFVGLVRANDGTPFAAVQGTAPPGRIVPEDLAGRTVRPATDYHLTANTTRFAVDATGPGVAVLGETYYPGDFAVTVDGRPAEYFRVNHAFKGVRIDGPGRHEIVFSYWPGHLSLALGLALAGALALAGTAGGLWISGREKSSADSSSFA